MVDVIFLGVEGYPSNGRRTISVLLKQDDNYLLLDCGASIIEQLAEMGMHVADVDAVFISHLHADHSSGLPLLCFGNIMERFGGQVKGKGHLSILGRESVLNPLIAYCKAAYPALWTDNPFVEMQMIFCLEDGLSEIDFGWGCAKTLPTDHAIPSTAIAVETKAGIICYCSDTRPSDALVELASKPSLLICNVIGPNEIAETTGRFGFMTPEAAGQLGIKLKAYKLALIHIANADQRRICQDQAAAVFGGQVLVPSNGETIGLEL